MLRLFNKNTISYEKNNHTLANQLGFLNGNYSMILRGLNYDHTRKSSLEIQLDFYLKQFLKEYFHHGLVVGGGNNYKFKKNISGFFTKTIYLDKGSFDVNSCCNTGGNHNIAWLYFVDSVSELNQIHKDTMSHAKEFNESYKISTPMLPIFVITRNSDSELNNIEKIKTQCEEIPILDSWYLDKVQYQKEILFLNQPNNTLATHIADDSWKRIMNHIELTYLRLAIARGLIYKELLDYQAEFFCATDQLNKKNECVPDVQNIIANYLFYFNVNKANENRESLLITKHESVSRCKIF